MRQKLFNLIITAMTVATGLMAQPLNFSRVKDFENQLNDVMELIDTTALKVRLRVTEENFAENPTEINKARLGIFWHETALNLSFLSKTEFKGYAKKSFDILSNLFNSPYTSKELMPFIASYRASALSLLSAETKNLKLLSEAFTLFNEAVNDYANISPLPEFLRGSVSENLPWFFFGKRKYAKKDFQSIIDKQGSNSQFANWKIMSFTYWAWAKQRQSRKYRTQALGYLEKAIQLDPDFKAGRKKAEALKAKMLR